MDIVSLSANLNVWAQSTIGSLGYLGIFLVSFIGTSTIIFPIPSFVVVPATAALPGMNPWIVGIVAGVGSALGEVIGYALGKGGGKLVGKKYEKQINKYKKWFERDGVFVWVIIFAATPLPDDIVGIICGMFNYDFKKFMCASVIGKILLNLFLALGGFYTIPWILNVIGVAI